MAKSDPMSPDVATDPSPSLVPTETSFDHSTLVPFDSGQDRPAKTNYGIPELRAFLDNPSQATHDAAAQLLAKCGDLAMDGRVFRLIDGLVKHAKPQRRYDQVFVDHSDNPSQD